MHSNFHPRVASHKGNTKDFSCEMQADRAKLLNLMRMVPGIALLALLTSLGIRCSPACAYFLPQDIGEYITMRPDCETRNDYTNNSEFNFCATDVRNRCRCNRKINSQTVNVCNWLFHRKCLIKAPNYTKEFLPENPVYQMLCAIGNLVLKLKNVCVIILGVCLHALCCWENLSTLRFFCMSQCWSPGSPKSGSGPKALKTLFLEQVAGKKKPREQSKLQRRVSEDSYRFCRKPGISHQSAGRAPPPPTCFRVLLPSLPILTALSVHHSEKHHLEQNRLLLIGSERLGVYTHDFACCRHRNCYLVNSGRSSNF